MILVQLHTLIKGTQRWLVSFGIGKNQVVPRDPDDLFLFQWVDYNVVNTLRPTFVRLVASSKNPIANRLICNAQAACALLS